jgi:trk system potassium uptake protein TrkA
MYIIIVGASKVGYNLTRSLIAEGHEVLLLEKDRAKYNSLVRELGECLYHGDGCEVETLKHVGASRAELLIAVTGRDEQNLVSCQLAKLLFMVPRTLAEINDPKHEELFKNLGVDLTVNTTTHISTLIGHRLNIEVLMPLLTFKNLEIVQADVYESSPAVQRPVRDLNLPPDTLLIAAVRNGEAVLLKGDSVLLPNDSVIALTSRETEKELRKIF